MPDSARGRSANAMGGVEPAVRRRADAGCAAGRARAVCDPTPDLARTGDGEAPRAASAPRERNPGGLASDLTPAPCGTRLPPGAIFLLKDGKPIERPVYDGASPTAHTPRSAANSSIRATR